MKALVIGGNGFIGSHLVDALRSAGDDVTVMDRGEPRGDVDWTGVRYLKGSLDDREALDRSLANQEIVYHLASTTVPSTSNADPIADVQGNLCGTLLLLDRMRAAGCRRIVYLSSGGTVYGETGPDLIDESHECAPICSYGVVKLAIEKYLAMYGRLEGLQALVLRASNPYGPRQGKLGIQGLVGTLFGRLLSGQPVDIWGDGSSVRDYIYVGDLVELASVAGRSDAVGVFNAGSGIGVSVSAMLDAISATTGVTPEVRRHPARGFDVSHIVLNVEKARRQFGWRPRTPLDEGLSRTLASFTAP